MHISYRSLGLTVDHVVGAIYPNRRTCGIRMCSILQTWPIHRKRFSVKVANNMKVLKTKIRLPAWGYALYKCLTTSVGSWILTDSDHQSEIPSLLRFVQMWECPNERLNLWTALQCCRCACLSLCSQWSAIVSGLWMKANWTSSFKYFRKNFRALSSCVEPSPMKCMDRWICWVAVAFTCFFLEKVFL